MEEKSSSISSSDVEEEKISETSLKKSESSLKKSDTNQSDTNKPYYSVYSSSSVEGEDKEVKNIKTNEKITINHRPSVIERGLIESVEKMENLTKENLDLAEKIKFKNNTDKLIETDEFGFFKKQTKNDINKDNTNKNEINIEKKDFHITQKPLSNKELLTINARTEKWKHMLDKYQKYSTIKRKKLKSRTRKGIPDSLRSYVWQLFAQTDKLKKKGLFESLDKEEMDKDTELVIIKDLDRTFPSCQLFKEKYGSGQRKLYRVLSNYSKYNKTLGYVQGMGYLAAIFLIYMDEESSFYMLDSFVKNYGFEGLYGNGFPDLKKKFYVFLNLEKKFIPKIYEILKRDYVYISIYASEWFLCLFAKDLPPYFLVRLIDIFLFEGYKVIYRFALAFLKMKEKYFINNKKGIFYSMNTIKQLFDDLNIDEIFKVAFSFRLSRSHIAKYEKEYEENIDNKNNEFIKQL
jgi:hypothetical protein